MGSKPHVMRRGSSFLATGLGVKVAGRSALSVERSMRRSVCTAVVSEGCLSHPSLPLVEFGSYSAARQMKPLSYTC